MHTHKSLTSHSSVHTDSYGHRCVTSCSVPRGVTWVQQSSCPWIHVSSTWHDIMWPVVTWHWHYMRNLIAGNAILSDLSWHGNEWQMTLHRLKRPYISYPRKHDLALHYYLLVHDIKRHDMTIIWHEKTSTWPFYVLSYIAWHVMTSYDGLTGQDIRLHHDHTGIVYI